MGKSSEDIIYFLISVITIGTMMMIEMKYPRKTREKDPKEINIKIETEEINKKGGDLNGK